MIEDWRGSLPREKGEDQTREKGYALRGQRDPLKPRIHGENPSKRFSSRRGKNK